MRKILLMDDFKIVLMSGINVHDYAKKMTIILRFYIF